MCHSYPFSSHKLHRLVRELRAARAEISKRTAGQPDCWHMCFTASSTSEPQLKQSEKHQITAPEIEVGQRAVCHRCPLLSHHCCAAANT
jgi:hypothetical protein